MRCRGTTLPVFVVMFGLFLLITPAAAVAADLDPVNDDHGNVFEDASVIAVDGSLNAGQIEVSTDVDVFKIDLGGLDTKEVVLRLSNWSPTIMPFLAVYDQNGQLIEWRDARPPMTEIVIGINPAGNETLFATVEDLEAGGTGLYALFAEIPNCSGDVYDLLDVSTKKGYRFAKARRGAKTYIDRNYHIKSISSGLKNGIMLRTANNDKYNNDMRHLVLDINRPADLFVCYDKRGAYNPPDWLDSEGWIRTGDKIYTTNWRASPYRVFKKTVYPGEFILGGNHVGGHKRANSNFFLIAKPAKAATVSKAKFVETLYVSNNAKYSLDKARKGSRPYIDRSYRIRRISEPLKNGILVKTANNDKRIKEEVHLVLYFHSNATVYLCYDKRGRGLPFWLKEEEWKRIDAKMVTSDRRAGPMQIFQQQVPAESELAFGGNRAYEAWGAHSNYFIIVKPEQLDPPTDMPYRTLTDGKPVGSFGSGAQTAEVTEPGQWRWAENFYGSKGIDQIKWMRDGRGQWHNYAIGWHKNDLAEYLMKFGGQYNRLILRGIADKPGPVQLGIYVDAKKVTTATLNASNNSNQDVKLKIEGIPYGTHAIAVKFENDKYKKGRYDRNMYLDGLKVTQ